MRQTRQKIRLLSLLILPLILISSLFLLPAYAADAPTPPDITDGRAYCLFDKTHNKMLVEKNGNERLNTSTSAKVMMGLLACEMLADRLGETVTVTDEMLSGVSGNSMKLQSGEQIKIEDLLYGAICGSYNDAAYVIASVCAESAQGFTDLMNEKAKELGANSTSYTNPIGYPDNAAMVTTLSDTLNIALAASENELYMEICSAKKHEIYANNSSSARTVYNRNYLVSSRSTQAYYNPVCQGMNAGISGEAGGWSVITLAKDDGADYICIVLGGSENEDGSKIYAYDTVNALVDWACETYNDHKVFDKGQVLGQAEIKMTALGTEKVDYATAEELSVYIPDHASPDVSFKVEYISDELEAPLNAGEKIGIARVYCNGEKVGECDVILTADCEANAVMKVIAAIGQYTKSRAFAATLIFLVIALPIAIVIKKSRSHTSGSYSRKF